MKNINVSLKSIILGFAIAGLFTTAHAATNTDELCKRGGYIKRISQGWPHETNVIAITLKDEYGTESNWTTNGEGDVNGHAWVRSLLAMALTAYTNQTYVYPTVKEGKCTDYGRGLDGRTWISHWKGLIFSPGPGIY